MHAHIETLLDMCSLTMEHYQFWLTEIARHYAIMENHRAMSAILSAWCGEVYAIPHAILERRHDEGWQVHSALRKCLREGALHKERLAQMQGYIRECLEEQILSPDEHAMLKRCASTLQDLDPDSPPFRKLASKTPPDKI
jgi:hypothetical protein